MRIEHIALWTLDLDRLREFYCTYFNAQSNDRYHNQKTGFQSYFLSFADGARLEIMTHPEAFEHPTAPFQVGWAHLAISVSSEAQVDALTERLRTDGFAVVSEPRRTGDGYYESTIRDPDGNLIEITA